ncbi:hypothetical protein GUJ93_ZPchr0005g15240 [Zizania palustris]|uniref:S1-like domain-containing protein n=1 Tax=Zizania palustris TaxID=103762 RepID=A0A8J5SSZ7_ZIZPA|nr:hypothetical protein GUJ93_ZPchr0005g15240 [Zizania palustris]
MHKKVWIAAGDIVLVGLRDYQDDKADVILKIIPGQSVVGIVVTATRRSAATYHLHNFTELMARGAASP